MRYLLDRNACIGDVAPEQPRIPRFLYLKVVSPERWINSATP